MFKKLKKTTYPPKGKPLMIWDGDCGFCKYWIIQWEGMTKDKIEYIPYQQVQEDFPDINVKHFKEAVRLIEPNGKIYNGPEAAYRAYQYAGKYKFLPLLYRKNTWFKNLSDYGYDWIATNRGFMMKLTKRAFGTDPNDPKPYWLVYLLVFIVLYSFFKRKKG